MAKLEANDPLVSTHATFRFAVDKFGIEAFDDRLIAVDEFHHVSANPDNKLGDRSLFSLINVLLLYGLGRSCLSFTKGSDRCSR